MSTLSVVADAGMDFGVADVPLMPVEARFDWDRDVPMEIVVTVRPHELVRGTGHWPPIEFRLTREMVNAALVDQNGTRFGHGDFTVRGGVCECDCAHDELVFATIFEGIERSIFVDAEPITHFLIRSFVMVPAFDESLDIDSALVRLFGGAE